jgi:23S rRNA A2030 N6-methylase RlmJ
MPPFFGRVSVQQFAEYDVVRRHLNVKQEQGTIIISPSFMHRVNYDSQRHSKLKINTKSAQRKNLRQMLHFITRLIKTKAQYT